jgi:L-ascorbate metabolism protein UlaG (beta-lactamase superfamily)
VSARNEVAEVPATGYPVFMISLTFYGHACFSVTTPCGTRLLFDPFITPNPLAAHIDVDSIAADYVLITHGHADHLADAEAILKRTGATLVSNVEIVTWFAAKGIGNAEPLNHGGGVDFPFGRVTYVNAVHSSSLPDGSYGGNPGGFVIRAGGTCLYVSGDTALHADQQLLGQRHRPDVAVLCIGDHFTMGPADAALAAKWSGVRRAVGVHYDTFPPIRIDRDAAIREFAAQEVELLLPAIGETVSL